MTKLHSFQYNDLAFMYGDCDNYGDVNVDVKDQVSMCTK